MAKKKLTIEDVLVPKEEIPYEVPDNWCWTRLGVAAEYINGKAFKSTDWKESGIPIVRIQNLTGSNNSFNYSDGNVDEKYFINNGDLLIAWSATLGAFIWNGGKAVLNQHIFKVKPKINKKYLFYLVNHSIDELYRRTQGTGMVHVTKKVFDSIEIPLPPLAEQERIVNRIESLFEKVNKSSDLIEEAREGFEKRRAAILEKAFSGALIQSKPQYIKLKECGEFIKDKKEPEVYDNYLGLEHFISGYGISNYSTGENVKSTKSKFLKGDILYGRLRPYLDKHDIVDKDGICSTDILIFRCNKDISINKYINYFMGTNSFKSYAIDNSQGINLPRVSARVLNELEIPIFTIKEQNKTVEILDNMIDKEFNIDELTTIDESIEMIRKSILAKAFRGELGSNDLREESSIDLLKEIL